MNKRKRRQRHPHLDVGDAGAQRVLHPGGEVISLLLRQTLRGCGGKEPESELRLFTSLLKSASMIQTVLKVFQLLGTEPQQ